MSAWHIVPSCRATNDYCARKDVSLSTSDLAGQDGSLFGIIEADAPFVRSSRNNATICVAGTHQRGGWFQSLLVALVRQALIDTLI